MPKIPHDLCMIDACVFVSAYGMESSYPICQKIINDSSYGYIGCISTLCIGEIKQSLREIITEKERYESIMWDFNQDLKKFNLVPLCSETLKYQRMLSRISVHDALHIACAIANKCTVLVTEDKKIIDEKEIIERISKSSKRKLIVETVEEFKNNKYT